LKVGALSLLGADIDAGPFHSAALGRAFSHACVDDVVDRKRGEEILSTLLLRRGFLSLSQLSPIMSLSWPFACLVFFPSLSASHFSAEIFSEPPEAGFSLA